MHYLTSDSRWFVHFRARRAPPSHGCSSSLSGLHTADSSNTTRIIWPSLDSSVFVTAMGSVCLSLTFIRRLTTPGSIALWHQHILSRWSFQLLVVFAGFEPTVPQKTSCFDWEAICGLMRCRILFCRLIKQCFGYSRIINDSGLLEYWKTASLNCEAGALIRSSLWSPGGSLPVGWKGQVLHLSHVEACWSSCDKAR